jgi:transposase
LTAEPSCKDEAREGQKGRAGHRWFHRGQRPPGRCDKRFTSTYIFGAVRPGTDDAFALILPEATAETMSVFLEEFAKTIPENAHVAMLLDQAGWHGAKALRVPDKITLVPLPPYSPELNPAEPVWLYLRNRFLSFRVYSGIDAIETAIAAAWNKLRAETGRLASITGFRWIKQALPGAVNG